MLFKGSDCRATDGAIRTPNVVYGMNYNIQECSEKCFNDQNCINFEHHFDPLTS